MLHDLLVPLAKYHSVFNVFRYITFRTAMADGDGAAHLVRPRAVGDRAAAPDRQRGGETIREDTPERHRTKAGTPTMGGLVILAAIAGLDAPLDQPAQPIRVGSPLRHDRPRV